MTSPLEQKKIKITGPSIVTANRTWDGAVIYRTAQQGWSAELGARRVAEVVCWVRNRLARASTPGV